LKISIVGDFNLEQKEKFLTLIDGFVRDHKVGVPVIICAGEVELLSIIDTYAKDKGFPSVILGNVLTLAILNGDKIIFVWDGENKKYLEMIKLAKKQKRPYIDLRTK